MKTFKFISIVIGSVLLFCIFFTAVWHSCSAEFEDFRFIFHGQDFGRGYHLIADGKNTLAINHPEQGIVVNNTVLEYAFDSTFIIASQRPWNDSIIPNMYGLRYDELQKAFKRSTYKQYWIINKKQKGEKLGVFPYPEYKMGGEEGHERLVYSNVYGPFLREEYLRKRKELGVPDSLVLKEDAIR